MKRLRILAVIVMAAVVAAGCGSGGATNPSNPSSPSFGASAGTRHANLEGLGLDYPSDWTLTPIRLPQHYASVLAYLASPRAHATESCGPNYVPGLGGDCTETLDVPDRTVVVRVSRLDGPPWPDGQKGRIAELVKSGWDAATIAGMPAAYRSPSDVGPAPAGSRTAEWIVAAPGSDDQVGYEIAVVAGPGMDPRAAAAPIVSSLTFTMGS